MQILICFDISVQVQNLRQKSHSLVRTVNNCRKILYCDTSSVSKDSRDCAAAVGDIITPAAMCTHHLC